MTIASPIQGQFSFSVFVCMEPLEVCSSAILSHQNSENKRYFFGHLYVFLFSTKIVSIRRITSLPKKPQIMCEDMICRVHNKLISFSFLPIGVKIVWSKLQKLLGCWTPSHHQSSWNCSLITNAIDSSCLMTVSANVDFAFFRSTRK